MVSPVGLYQPTDPNSLTAAIITPYGSSYINPLAGGNWSPSRVDQGEDWIPNVTEPVQAIGQGVVVNSSTSSGWPGGAWISYRLTSGPEAGDVVYVAEHLANLAPVGTVLQPGDTIATAEPGYPWTEWGWANAAGTGPATPYGSSPDGTPTPGGAAFARFMQSLGAPASTTPVGPGPLDPGGQTTSGATLTSSSGGGVSYDAQSFINGWLHLGELLLGGALVVIGLWMVVADLRGSASVRALRGPFRAVRSRIPDADDRRASRAEKEPPTQRPPDRVEKGPGPERLKRIKLPNGEEF